MGREHELPRKAREILAKMEHNPYSPPSTISTLSADVYESGRVWREGDVLCIQNGAALPNRCFVTGEATKTSFPVAQFWQPTWVYLLLIPAIIPYLIASPILGQTIRLEVPISPRVCQKHLRTARNGFRILVASGIAFSLGVMAAWNYAYVDPILIAVLILQAFPLGLIGLVLSSKPPLRLKIVSLEGEVLKLRGIHPDCLAAVPGE